MTMTNEEKQERANHHTQSHDEQICEWCGKQFKTGNVVYEDITGNYYCTIKHFKMALGLEKTKL
ncbi:hypothetical protein OZX69_09500 (plasmid) [Lactobacillus sp. ESL0731]|uniref:hypothetical protein n=1 Tax=unclassified Lactobacillus TaxID=2620435 RepID=UPI0023F8708A|nr:MULTISPECIES: hypothetical protein [unclassified Lactobacillus]WEV52123.1 hypothetical protein OZX63_09530 [Lactobacillus sp. ESL0700]WEV63244.1 hypothetical protein OZX69_09500 [Lactobacillus sp. ESL0731]